MATDIPVIIVGGGLTGLSAAVFLARRGVRCLAVERHSTTSIQYKFAGISPRTMEIYREAGIEQDIRASVTRDQKAGGIARMKNLSEPSTTWDRASAWPDTSDISPESSATLDQDKLEPILKAHAESFGADIRLNTELVDFEQDHSEVRARIRNRATGKEEVLTTDYLIAADGANGTVREKVGIGRHGPGVLQRWMNIIFEADMPRTLEGRQLT